MDWGRPTAETLRIVDGAKCCADLSSMAITVMLLGLCLIAVMVVYIIRMVMKPEGTNDGE